MTKPIIKIHDTETGEIIEREMNAEEYDIYQLSIGSRKLTTEEIQAQTAKEAAQAKLAALGLTTDDLKALGL
jgi:hypothetical protein